MVYPIVGCMGEEPSVGRIGNFTRQVSRVMSAPLAERGILGPPPYLFIEMNRRCNHRCIMCDIWKQQIDGLPLAEIERIFSVPFFDKLERVILAGGEPTIRLDLKDVARYFIERLPRLQAIAILTNGYNTQRTMDGSLAILDAMDARADRKQSLHVQVALDGIGEVYNEVRGIKKAWSRTSETIAQLSQLSSERDNFSVMLHVVLQPKNLHQLDEIDAFAKELGVSVIFSPVVISDTYFSNADHAAELTFDDEQKRLVQQFLLSRKDQYTGAMPFYYEDVANMLDGEERSRKCMYGYYYMYVKMDGTVFPCLNSGDLSMGNLRTQAPEEIWKGPHSMAMRRKVREDFCPGCGSACDNNITSAKELAITVKNRIIASTR